MYNALLTVHHSLIRLSAKDGVQVGFSAGASILNSQVVSNSQVITTTYGVYNSVPARLVLATNDWWGDPAGPTSDLPACSAGHGSRVSAGVLFRPILTSTTASAEFPLSNDPQITLTPRRWFAPADGTKIFIDITLRDGNGAPLPNRTVQLSAPGAAIHDGGITDATGHTLAYITSGSTGDVDVSASLVATAACENALSPVARVTFTAPLIATDLFPNAQAPYFSNDLTITPRPLIDGVSTTLSLKLTNPLSVPITVEVQLGFAQSGIGLAFGPIHDFTGEVIPPNSSLTLQTNWLPLISGHYCFQASYSITGVGGGLTPLAPAGGSQLKQWNENVSPGPTTPPSSKDSLNKADKAINKVKKLPGGAGPIHQGIFDGWWDWVKDTVGKTDQNLGGDPPRQDYTVISVPVSTTWPTVQPGGSIPAERATALNAVSDALVNVAAYGQAASIAFDRYGGAAAAGDLTWEAQQANAQQYYQQQMGAALLTYADRLDTFVQVLQTEGVTDTTISASDIVSYQLRLNSPGLTGFTLQEIADAHNAGLTDADLERYKQELLAANPSDIAGDLLDSYTNEAAVSRELGNALLHPYNFNPGFSVSGSAGLQQPATTTATGNSMVQIYNTTSSFEVSNTLPLSLPVVLQTRRIDLPADWAVQVSPALVTTTATVTVTIIAGSPLPQGSLPRVAVEGYKGSLLLGGVVVDVVAPQYVFFDGHLRLYLPLIRR